MPGKKGRLQPQEVTLAAQPTIVTARVETDRQLWLDFRAEALKHDLTLPEAVTQILQRVKQGEIKLKREKR